MSTNGSTNNVTAIETDMRDVLRERKARLSDVSRETDNDYSSLVSGISVRSVQEIDHLIDGLQGLREKLNNDGDRLHRQIAQYGAFGQSVIELTKIVSDGMASVNKSSGI
jgi:hypothetical protein